MRFGIYTNSQGNYFHDEIAELIFKGLEDSHTVFYRNEINGFDSDLDWHLVIAPHEFFYLGNGISLSQKEWPENVIFVTTEQIQSSWYSLAEKLFYKTKVIWDIDETSSHLICQKNYNCFHLPLGYHPKYPYYNRIDQLPNQSGYYFGNRVQNSKSYLEEPFNIKPIDLFFIGAYTHRRSIEIAKLSGKFSSANTAILMIDTSKPVGKTNKSLLSSRLIFGLEQRSRIVLNIHRDEHSYYESHRMIMHGIAQNALVISEINSESSYYSSYKIIETDSKHFADCIAYYLYSATGKAEAQEIIENNYRQFKSKPVSLSINNLISNLKSYSNV